jgi:eukaryotic-like serine/threonine-protein kinase
MRTVPSQVLHAGRLHGLDCVRALISIAQGDLNAASHAIEHFVSLSRRPCEILDLTLVNASVLIGLSELIETCPASETISQEAARDRGAEIAAEIVQLLSAESVATSTAIPSLGVAHGWGGFLFAVLRWAGARPCRRRMPWLGGSVVSARRGGKARVNVS